MDGRRPLGPRAARPSLSGLENEQSYRRREGVLMDRLPDLPAPVPAPDSFRSDPQQQPRQHSDGMGSRAVAAAAAPERNAPRHARTAPDSSRGRQATDPSFAWTDAGQLVDSPGSTTTSYTQQSTPPPPRLVSGSRPVYDDHLPYTQPSGTASQFYQHAEPGPSSSTSNIREAVATSRPSPAPRASSNSGPRTLRTVGSSDQVRGPRPFRPRTLRR
ncbi:hypothetical protein BKA62DRAFT_49560 [Auriculariales sp. MPI-PUGE-AT-0066]|nr:hypothetical protein BKA62DRAFT_49560 [Auriculariales sp. MPI-PUGE-AT-0066]